MRRACRSTPGTDRERSSAPTSCSRPIPASPAAASTPRRSLATRKRCGDSWRSIPRTRPPRAVRAGGTALTYLCFSRYLRLDRTRSDGFVSAATVLLDAGASANTGWTEPNHQPKPEWESAIYGAAGVARHPELTRLLLERGADPNDGETPYHVPETYDNATMKVLVESGKLTAGEPGDAAAPQDRLARLRRDQVAARARRRAGPPHALGQDGAAQRRLERQRSLDHRAAARTRRRSVGDRDSS